MVLRYCAWQSSYCWIDLIGCLRVDTLDKSKSKNALSTRTALDRVVLTVKPRIDSLTRNALAIRHIDICPEALRPLDRIICWKWSTT